MAPMSWEKLPTLVRRSFLAYLDGDPRNLARSGEPRVRGDDVLVPFVDRATGRGYVARVSPDGAVTSESA